ncbi:MAG: tetratricopeptide repeat protein [Pseudomonadota bacterium]
MLLPSATSAQIIATPSSKSEAGQAVKPAPTVEFPKDLDGLFTLLGKTRDKKMGDRIAQQIWEIWRTSDSKSIDLLTRWAIAAGRSKRYGKALDLLDQVVVLRPDYAEGYNQRATLHYMMRNYGKSIVDIERTLALEPRHFGALSGLASILETLERKQQALETWYRVLSVYPANEGAQKAVVRLEEELAGRGI